MLHDGICVRMCCVAVAVGFDSTVIWFFFFASSRKRGGVILGDFRFLFLLFLVANEFLNSVMIFWYGVR